ISEVDTLDMPRLIARAYEHGDAAKVLLVKGETDYVVKEGQTITTISEPNIAAMEPIGGTGDTITGIASALIYGGFDIIPASIIAAKTNRIAGLLCHPTPATHIGEIVAKLPEALTQVLATEGGAIHAKASVH
ncbi:MAG TPA: NAD(P)H-hydrate dehydratase, partial [Anaerolineae bacterium]